MDVYVFCCSFPEIFPTIMDGNSVDESASSSYQTSTRPQSTMFQLDPDHLTPGPSVTAESAPSVCDGTDFVCFILSEWKS